MSNYIFLINYCWLLLITHTLISVVNSLLLCFFPSVFVNFLPDVFVFLLNGHILLFKIIYIKSFLLSLKDEWFFVSEYFFPTSVDPEK